MKTTEINIRITDGVVNATDGKYLMIKEIKDLSTSLQAEITAFAEKIDAVRRQSKPIIDIPDTQLVYTMIKPCPVRGDLTVRLHYLWYNNDPIKKEIRIDLLAVHYDENNERVPEYDDKSYVIADMSEEGKIEVSEGVYEYSYTLANTFLENAMPINDLITMACQIADADGSLNKRIYNI